MIESNNISYEKKLVATCTSKQKHYIEQKKKKAKCKLDNSIVLSGKNLPQCTVGDRSVVCTIHHFAYIKKDTSETPTIYVWSNTSSCAGKKERKFIFTKNESIYLVLAYKLYHYKCSVHILYISAPQVKAL